MFMADKISFKFNDCSQIWSQSNKSITIPAKKGPDFGQIYAPIFSKNEFCCQHQTNYFNFLIEITRVEFERDGGGLSKLFLGRGGGYLFQWTLQRKM